jgi:hypothetical protein
LELHQDQLTTAGLQNLGIAMGPPKHVELYCGKLAPSMTCLTDETTLPYQTYGLQQGKEINLKTIIALPWFFPACSSAIPEFP